MVNQDIPNKKRIFISRDLDAESPFLHRLSPRKHKVYGMSLIDFKPLTIQQIPSTDILFFYSKKGVEFALKNEILTDLMHQKKLATIGQGTADFLQINGFEASFIGTGKPLKTAQLLDDFYPHKTILFLRAKHSKQSVQQLLSDPKRVFDLAIYANTIKKNIAIPPSDILVFTSPMNTQAYFEKYKLQKHQQVIAIGNTTAQALNDLGIKEVIIAKKPSEKALFDVVIKLLQ